MCVDVFVLVGVKEDINGEIEQYMEIDNESRDSLVVVEESFLFEFFL